LAWLDAAIKHLDKNPLHIMDTTNIVESAFNVNVLLPEKRLRFRRVDDLVAFLTGFWFNGTRYVGSLQDQCDRERNGRGTAAQSRVTGSRGEIFMEMAACILLLAETWARRALTERKGATCWYYFSNKVRMSSFTGRPDERRVAYSSDPAFNAGRKPLADLYDSLHFPEATIPKKAGKVRGNSENLETDSYDCTAAYYGNGSHYTAALRLIKQLGLAGARQYANEMLPLLARSIRKWDMGPLVNTDSPNDELIDQVVRLATSSQQHAGSEGTATEQAAVLDHFVKHLKADMLPNGWAFDGDGSKTGLKQFYKLGADGETAISSFKVPRMTKELVAGKPDRRSPGYGLKANKSAVASTASERSKASPSSPGGTAAAKRPVPVSARAPVQSAKCDLLSSV